MKLSQFKGLNIRKKFEFINGEMIETYVREPKIDGGVNFYTLDIQRLEVINDEVISKLEDDEKHEFLMYKIIPYITDVECDIEFDEFMKMLDNPSKMFTTFIKEVILSVEELFGTISEFANLINASEKLSNEVGAIEETKDDAEMKVENSVSEEADLDKEMLIENLFNELSKVSDREKRKKIIKRISELQKE